MCVENGVVIRHDSVDLQRVLVSVSVRDRVESVLKVTRSIKGVGLLLLGGGGDRSEFGNGVN